MRVNTATLCAIEIHCHYIEFPFSFYADVDTRVVVTNDAGRRAGELQLLRRIPDPDEITVDIPDAQVYGGAGGGYHRDIIPARYSAGNAGRICIFLRLEDGGLTGGPY